MDSPSPTEHMFLSATPGRHTEPDLLMIGPDYAEDETLRYLRDQYNLAKLKAKDLNAKSDVSSMKPRTRKAAAKLYSAVATVIYTTISSAKTSDVEKFIEKRAAQIPADYFDASYWQEVLDTAAEVRGWRQIKPTKTAPTDMISKSVIKSYFQEMQRRARDLHAEHCRYKSFVEKELSMMQDELSTAKASSDHKTQALQSALIGLKISNDSLKQTVHSLMQDGTEPAGEPTDRMYTAEEVEQLRRRIVQEGEQKKQQQIDEILHTQREADDARQKTELVVMEKHRQDLAALVFENTEKMKELQSKHDLLVKNMSFSYNLQVEQLLARIAMMDQIPPVRDLGAVCGDCSKHHSRIVELEAGLAAQQQKVAELQDKSNSTKEVAVTEIMRACSNVSEIALYSSFSNVEDIVERSKLQKEIDGLREALKNSSANVAPPDKSKELLQTQLKINKDLLNQIDDLKFKLQMVDRSQSSRSMEAEKRDIIRKNSSLITMNYINGTIGKTVSAKVAARIDDLQRENDSLKEQLQQEHRISSALASQNTSLQLQELKSHIVASGEENRRLRAQLTDLLASQQKTDVNEDVSDLVLEQCRQHLNAEISLNEELKAVNLNMQEQLVTTTADYTKLQFQHGLTAEQIMILRQRIQDLEAQQDAHEKRIRDAAIVGTTASLRRQHSNQMASNIVVNAIASSVQKSASIKSASYKQSLEAEEVAQLKKSISDLQRQLTEQDIVYSERMSTLQLALVNAAKKNELLEQARLMQDKGMTDAVRDNILYRQVSEIALKTVNESVVASVLNSIDILSRPKFVEISADPSIDAFDSHFSAELKNQGILVAAPGTVQGNTGWYTIDEQYMYFCNLDDAFMLVCGPLSDMEYALAVSDERLSPRESTIEMNPQCGSVDKSIPGGPGINPFEMVAVELCAIRGAAIQRDRLLRKLAEREDVIDLVVREPQVVQDDHITLHISRDDDDTYTLASVSVFENEDAMVSVGLDQISSVEVTANEDGHINLSHGGGAIKHALSRINSSMYIKEVSMSAASSVVSISQADGADDRSAVVSITDDGGSKASPRAHESIGNQGAVENGMSNIVTSVIIKMLRKEIRHLKELSIADSQLISSLKARVYDDESTMASDTDYIKFMNKKLLSESNLQALYAEESPREFGRDFGVGSQPSQSPREDDGFLSARRRSRVRALEAVKEEHGKESVREHESVRSMSNSRPVDADEPTFSNLELMGVIKSLREDVHAYKGMLMDDSVIISALKQRLGLEDTDEIEIPGYIGVHSVRTTVPNQSKTFTDADAHPKYSDPQLARGDSFPDNNFSSHIQEDGGRFDENAELKHKVHILRNLMIQQSSQVRHLMKAAEDQQNGDFCLAPTRLLTDQQLDVDFENFVSKINTLVAAKEELVKLHYQNQDYLSVIKGFEIQVNSLQTELGEAMIQSDREKDKAAIVVKGCREDLSAARAALLSVNEQLDQFKYRHTLKEESMKREANLIDDGRYKMARKIQGRIRMFIAKRRVRSVRQMLAARAANVLFALKYTTQGETGWYAAPDGSLFYFVLDGDSWILACGPVKPSEYNDVILKANMALSASQKAILHGDVLVKCSFELSNIGENQESRGDLFMSAKTHRLYISISLETVVISDGSRIISDGGGSRTMVGLEDSNSMLQLGDITNGSTTLLPGELSTEPA